MIVDYLNYVDFRQLHLIIEYRNEHIYRTQAIGFVTKDYVPKKNEMVSSLSTSMIGKEIKLLK